MISDITFSMTLPTIQPCEEDLFSFLSRSLHLLTSDQWSSYKEEVNAHRELASGIEGWKKRPRCERESGVGWAWLHGSSSGIVSEALRELG